MNYKCAKNNSLKLHSLKEVLKLLYKDTCTAAAKALIIFSKMSKVDPAEINNNYNYVKASTGFNYKDITDYRLIASRRTF